MAIIVERNLVGITAFMLVVFYRRLAVHYMTRHGVIDVKTTSSTKPEVDKVS